MSDDVCRVCDRVSLREDGWCTNHRREAGADTSWHGRPTGYNHHRCRCVRCRGWMREYRRGLRGRLSTGNVRHPRDNAEWPCQPEDTPTQGDAPAAIGLAPGRESRQQEVATMSESTARTGGRQAGSADARGRAA